jgi:hypothetical protein
MDEDIVNGPTFPSTMSVTEFERLRERIKGKTNPLRELLFDVLDCDDMVNIILQYSAAFVVYILNASNATDTSNCNCVDDDCADDMEKTGILFSLSHHLYSRDSLISTSETNHINVQHSKLEYGTLSEMRLARKTYLEISSYRTVREEGENPIYFIEENVLMLYLKIMSDSRFISTMKEKLIDKLERYVLDNFQDIEMPTSISDLMPSKKRKLYKQTTLDDTKRIKNVK